MRKKVHFWKLDTQNDCDTVVHLKKLAINTPVSSTLIHRDAPQKLAKIVWDLRVMLDSMVLDDYKDFQFILIENK